MADGHLLGSILGGVHIDILTTDMLIIHGITGIVLGTHLGIIHTEVTDGIVIMVGEAIMDGMTLGITALVGILVGVTVPDTVVPITIGISSMEGVTLLTVLHYAEK